jgi:sterol 3beta-glucosyltransferase
VRREARRDAFAPVIDQDHPSTADVRAIVAKGWSSRGQDPAKEGEDIIFPAQCYALDKIPHGWLFPRIDAALHHGGAGTVGASLRAGIPTLVKPWFGDQFFWALRVTKLGAGLKVASTSVDDLANALTRASKDVVMKERAAMVGEKIRAVSDRHSGQGIYKLTSCGSAGGRRGERGQVHLRPPHSRRHEPETPSMAEIDSSQLQ